MNILKAIIERYQKKAIAQTVDHVALGKAMSAELWAARTDAEVGAYIQRELDTASINWLTTWHRAASRIKVKRNGRRKTVTRNYSVTLRDEETLQLQGRRHQSWYECTWKQFDVLKTKLDRHAENVGLHQAVFAKIDDAHKRYPDACTPGQAWTMAGGDLDEIDLDVERLAMTLLAAFAGDLVWLDNLSYEPFTPTNPRARSGAFTCDVVPVTGRYAGRRFPQVYCSARSPSAMIRDRLLTDDDSPLLRWIVLRDNGAMPKQLLLGAPSDEDEAMGDLVIGGGWL